MKANEIDMHWFRYRDGCLRSNSTDADIDRAMSGNLCRCATYHKIRRAIHRAAGNRGTA